MSVPSSTDTEPGQPVAQHVTATGSRPLLLRVWYSDYRLRTKQLGECYIETVDAGRFRIKYRSPAATYLRNILVPSAASGAEHVTITDGDAAVFTTETEPQPVEPEPEPVTTLRLIDPPRRGKEAAQELVNKYGYTEVPDEVERVEGMIAELTDTLLLLNSFVHGPYANCSQAKADGVCNIPQSSPYYMAKLDRDGGGVACEC